MSKKNISPIALATALVLANSMIAIATPGAAITQTQTNTDTNTVVTSQQIESFDAKAQITALPQPLTQQINTSEPLYSLKASDLHLKNSALELKEFFLSNLTLENQISEGITQQPLPVDNPTPDKSQYNIFNPTPKKLWRELSTDRPDRTESPFTVDAGSFAIETDLLVYTKDTNSPDGTRTESFNIFIPNFKVGLTNNADLQIIPEVYNIVRTKPRDSKTEEISGFGDLTVRVKVNLWGNDGGKTAFAMLPFVKFPTNQNNLGNNAIEGGMIFPLAIELSDKWDVSMMTEFDVNKNEAHPGYNVGFVNSVSFGYAIDSKWSTYFELYTETTTEKDSQFVATFDTGLKYLLTMDVQFDAGINIGLTEAADDFQPFLGLSMRF